MARRARKRIGNLLMGLVVTPAAVFSLPATIPVAAVLRGLDTLRIKRLARRLRCPACGQLVGRHGVDLADGAAERFLHELKRWHPQARFTLVRVLYAICPQCRAHYEIAPTDPSLQTQAPGKQPFLICSCFLWDDA
jgi:hypothetical protein